MLKLLLYLLHAGGAAASCCCLAVPASRLGLLPLHKRPRDAVLGSRRRERGCNVLGLGVEGVHAGNLCSELRGYPVSACRPLGTHTALVYQGCHRPTDGVA